MISIELIEKIDELKGLKEEVLELRPEENYNLSDIRIRYTIIGKRAKDLVRSLKNEGFTTLDIAEILEVPVETVNRLEG